MQVIVLIGGGFVNIVKHSMWKYIGGIWIIMGRGQRRMGESPILELSSRGGKRVEGIGMGVDREGSRELGVKT